MTDPYDDGEGHGGSPHEAFDPDQLIGPDDVLTGVVGDEEILADDRLRHDPADLDPYEVAVTAADVDTPEGYDVYRVINAAGEVVRRIVVSEGLEVGDLYHTMDELYDHRRKLTAVLATIGSIHGDSWRSKRHHPDDGPMFDGSFIVGIELPAGPISYHYPLEAWDEFAAVPELEHAPKWDGAGPADTLTRLTDFTAHLKAAIDEGRIVEEAAREAADEVVEAAERDS